MYGKKRPNDNYQREQFREKKQVRSFRDLEVYRESVLVCQGVLRVIAPLARQEKYPNRLRLTKTALLIPVEIADGYGTRFHDFEKGCDQLNSAIQHCNRMMCYSDQLRELYLEAQEGKAACDELIQKYFFIRLKLQNLLKTWRKWNENPPYRSSRSSSRSPSEGRERFSGSRDSQNEDARDEGASERRWRG